MSNKINYSIARETYEEFLNIVEFIKLHNQLFSAQEVFSKLGSTTDAVIYRIQELLLFNAGEDTSYNIIIDSLEDKIDFCDVYETLSGNKECDK